MSTDLETPPVAAKEAVGTFVDDDNLKKLREDANVAVKRVEHRDDKFVQHLERRQTKKDGPDAMKASIEARENETERREEQEKAAAEAQERASKWIAPDERKGRMKDVEILLHPEEKVRKMSIQIRVLGEVPDGFVRIFEVPADKNDAKEGRVAESPRFGTKNKVRIDEVDPKTGLGKGEHTHPGYFDFGPLRMNPGKYKAVVVDMDDKVLAQESFKIEPDRDGDGRSDQVKDAKSRRKGAVLTVAESEAIRASMAEQQVARQSAKAAGEKVPPPPSAK